MNKETSSNPSTMSRRNFLASAGAVAGLGILTACGPAVHKERPSIVTPFTIETKQDISPISTPVNQPVVNEKTETVITPEKVDYVKISIDLQNKIGESKLSVGITHTQESLNPWGDPEAIKRGKQLLAECVGIQNQNLYGWGTTNPHPNPTEYDWKSLDRRLDSIRKTGGSPIITLCAAPDWMTELGENSSKYREIPPIPEHYKDFANLAATVAKRYPDVKHFIVWNEMRGFWRDDMNNWNYPAYTQMYNYVYDSLKEVNSDIMVGGPWLVIEGTGSDQPTTEERWSSRPPLSPRNKIVLEHWWENKIGADFIVLDRNIHDSHDPKMFDSNEYTSAELLSFTKWFSDIPRQIREMGIDMPLWWGEHHFAHVEDWELQKVGFASMLYHELLGGSSVALHWGPQGKIKDVTEEDLTKYNGNDENLWSDTRVEGGGQPYPTYSVYKAFNEHFGPDTPLYEAISSSDTVEVLASAQKSIIINKNSHPVTIRINNGEEIILDQYGFKVFDNTISRGVITDPQNR